MYQLDIKELQKSEIHRNSSDAAYRVNNVSIPGHVGFEDIELYFDSVNRDRSSILTSGELKWNLHSMNSLVTVKGCIEAKIGSFYFPKIYSAISKPELLYFRRIMLELRNAPSLQGSITTRGRFHFEFDIDDLSGQVLTLTPLKSSSYFNRPVNFLDEMIFRFYIPSPTSGILIPLNLPPESTTAVAIAANPIQFTIADTSIFELVVTPTAPGIAVYITGFRSDLPLIDLAVNSVNGVYVTDINSSTVITVAGIDFTGGVQTGGTVATIFIPKNRIAMSMRFTCVKDNVTNHTVVSHV